MTRFVTAFVICLVCLGTSTFVYAQKNSLQLRNGTYSTTLISNSDATVSVIYALPVSDGSSGQALVTNGSGVLSWSAAGASSITDLSDAQSGGTYFTNSLMLGQKPGGLAGAAAGNTAVGIGSLMTLSDGDYNTALGYNALNELTTGLYNTVIGYNAMGKGTSIGYNTVVGAGAGGGNAGNTTTASYNVAIGNDALGGITTGTNNVAIGVNAGLDVTTGTYNVFIGNQAGQGAGNVSGRLYIDANSGSTPLIYGDFSADALTFNGTTTTTGNVTAMSNVLVGGGAANSELRILEIASDGSNYTAFKVQAQAANVTYTLPAADGTSGYALVTNGSGALSWAAAASSIDGLSDAKSGGTGFDSSILLGHQTTGVIDALNPAAYNTAIGYEALKLITTGDQNVGLGHNALNHLTSGSYNVAIGANAGYDLTTATHNVFIGLSAGELVRTGSNNVAIGWGVLKNSGSGANNNVGIGDRALYSGISGDDNVGVGAYTLHLAGAASKNVVLGSNAGQLTTTGSNNVLIGFEAGKALTTGTGNILIGYQAGLSLTTTSDGLYIDNSSTSTPLVQGDFSANTLTFNAASVTIGDGSATAGEVRFREPSGSNYSAFKAAAQTSDITYTLPQSDGSSGQVLSTNGSGTLTWTTATSVAAINDLTDAVKNIANFSNSMVLGTEVSTMTGASNNTAVGMAAMDAITSGDNNAVFGYDAAAVLSDGSENVIIGSGAGALLVSGSGNVMIGYQAGASETGSNKLYIDNSSSATPLIQGDFSANTLTFNGSTTTTGTTTYTAKTDKSVTATLSDGSDAPDIATFTGTFERVAVTAVGTGPGYVQLPAGTDGQVVYLRLAFTAASGQTVTVVNSNNQNTTIVYDGTGPDVIIVHMLYTTDEGWVRFSTLEYDN